MISAELLRKNGLKVTRARIAILDVLQDRSGEHMTTEAMSNYLNQRGEKIALATIYRVLDLFFHHKMLIKVQAPNQKTYYEWHDGHDHDHFICTSCESLIELKENLFEGHIKKLAQKYCFSIRQRAFTLYGLCLRCIK